MKKTILLCLFYFPLITLYAQINVHYETLIAKAGLLHLQKNYKAAINDYEQAFKIQSPDALTAYKAAGAYALNQNADKAFYYLQISLDKGWTEANWLANDPYFDYLKDTASEKWKALEKEAFDKEEQYSKTLKLSSLRKEINMMTLKDQQLRFKRSQTNNDSLLAVLNREIHKSDFNNLQRAKSILKEYGWPTIAEIGKDGQNNLWLIVQHADQDIAFQKSALLAMEKLKGTTALNLENYAFLYDRVQCNLNYKQQYGTQVLWTGNGTATGFRPISVEYEVNERRKKMGLQPLEIYSLTYGFSYQPINKDASQQRDINYQKQVQKLISQAKIAYKNKRYQQTYDDYNQASTFLGGMSDEDNFEAAVIFSKIAANDPDGKYKSIALDFLDLLNIRNTLTKAQLLGQPAFNILKNEERWIKLNKQK